MFKRYFFFRSNQKLSETFLFCIYLTLVLTNDIMSATENFAENYNKLTFSKLATEFKNMYSSWWLLEMSPRKKQKKIRLLS